MTATSLPLISNNTTDLEAIVALYPANRSPDVCPSHPGALIDDILPATGKSKTEIARLLGISRQHLYDIMGERKPVSPEVAVRLGKLFGDGPGVWVRMQAAYDTWHAERSVDLSSIPTLELVRDDPLPDRKL